VVTALRPPVAGRPLRMVDPSALPSRVGETSRFVSAVAISENPPPKTPQVS
jgi:hypothetical protein